MYIIFADLHYSLFLFFSRCFSFSPGWMLNLPLMSGFITPTRSLPWEAYKSQCHLCQVSSHLLARFLGKHINQCHLCQVSSHLLARFLGKHINHSVTYVSFITPTRSLPWEAYKPQCHLCQGHRDKFKIDGTV